jgi:5-methylcytosine-specific restriction endonuclease McrA
MIERNDGMIVFVESGRKRTGCKITCDNCGNEFVKAVKNIRKHKHNFCCVRCAHEYPTKKRIFLRCSTCGDEFTRPRYATSAPKHNHHFCSRKCKDIAQRIGGIIEIQPSNYQDGHTTYRDTTIRRDGAICFQCGYKKHSEALEVHHIDGNRRNNKQENLVVLCCNCHRLVTRGVVVLRQKEMLHNEC